MPTQRVTIEIDVPDGREAVFSHQSPGFSEHLVFFELRDKWQPPAWLKPGWICQQADGTWWWTTKEPRRITSDDWIETDDKGMFCLTGPPYLDFTPPPCTDWKLSLRRIGEAK